MNGTYLTLKMCVSLEWFGLLNANATCIIVCSSGCTNTNHLVRAFKILIISKEDWKWNGTYLILMPQEPNYQYQSQFAAATRIK